MTFNPLSRRTFLRAAGVSMALPFLDSMLPRAEGQEAAAAPRRMICICGSFGVYAPYFFPKTGGRNYDSTPYMDILREHREDYTVISGLSHPGSESAGHGSETTFLTGAWHPELAGFRNSISVDQLYADKIGPATRYASLVLGTGPSHLSVNRRGVRLPTEQSPSRLFARLFLDGTKAEVQQ